VPAIEPLVRFERLSVEDGLSQNSISAIEQGGRGFMWFGTYDGLNRYDGYQFKHFSHDPNDNQSLSNNIVRVIYTDSDNRLWIGTRNWLNRMDRQSGQFTRYPHDEQNPNS
jgi:ligand-binding sensor domain-containing protein